MNEHEAERVAHAINALRPDWPTASVLTFIKTKLIDRPRRDVAVALVWVACESSSEKPARVLESGPWWKAASVDGESTASRLADRGPWCKNCGVGESMPIHQSGECEFTLWPAQIVSQARKEAALAKMREEMAANPGPAVVEPMAEDDGPCSSTCVRGAGHTGPCLAPAEAEAKADAA